MKDKDTTNNQPKQDDEKIHVSKSVFQTAHEIQTQQRDEEERLRLEMEQKIADKEKKKREAYEQRLLEEKKELIRMKQGIIEESEIIPEVSEAVAPLSPWRKFTNFIYHNKWWLGLAIILVALVIFLITDIMNRDHPDIIVMVLTENFELGNAEGLADYIESFSDDFNDDGEVLASVYYIPYSDNYRANYANGTDTKLSTQLQSCDSVIFIGGELISEVFDGSDALTDLSELYPDNPNVKECKFMLKGTDFAQRIGISDDCITDDLFLAVRKPQQLVYADLDEFQEVYDRDFPVFDSIIKELSE